MIALIQITKEESEYIDEQNEKLTLFEKYPHKFTDEEVQTGFDHFFETICSWRDRYKSQNLADFWAIGIDYDGYAPGKNPSFLGLYRELMDRVADKVLDKPVIYIVEIDGENVEVEYYDDETEKIIGPVRWS